MDAVVIVFAVGLIYLANELWAYYQSSQTTSIFPQVIVSEVSFSDGEWQTFTLPLAVKPKPISDFQIRLEVNIPSILFTKFHFRQQRITGLQINGRSVDTEFPIDGENAYQPDLREYIRKGMNTFLITIHDDDDEANFDIQHVPVTLRNAQYRLPTATGGWIPFTMPLVHVKQSGDGEKIFVALDVILNSQHNGTVRFEQDLMDSLIINGMQVDASYPVRGTGKLNLRKYLVIPGENRVNATIRDVGQIHNFNMYLENVDRSDSILVFVVKCVVILAVATYGAWRIRYRP